jgi:hypothetical protein|tara:strand:+ start:266 stop:481 length:216 start_codon:yes stop_codon:yes gene_type:complete
MPNNENWIKSATDAMDKKGTVGVFSAKAKRAGMSTKKYAKKTIVRLKGKKKTKTQTKLLRQAVFARNAGGY